MNILMSFILGLIFIILLGNLLIREIKLSLTLFLILLLTSCNNIVGVPYGNNYRKYIYNGVNESTKRVVYELTPVKGISSMTINSYEFIRYEALYVNDSKVNSESLKEICKLVKVSDSFIGKDFIYIDDFYTLAHSTIYNLEYPIKLDITDQTKLAVPSFICDVINYEIEYIEYDKQGNKIGDGVLKAFYITSLDGYFEIKYY